MKYSIGLLAIFAHFAIAETPSLEVKGIAMGSDMQSVVESLYRNTTDQDRPAPRVEFGNVFRDKASAGDFRTSRIALVQRTQLFERRGGSRGDSYAGIDADVAYYFNAPNLEVWDAAAEPAREQAFGGWRWKYRELTESEREARGKMLLGNIQIVFDSSYFRAVVDALISKYGEPHQSHVVSMRNGLGATFKADEFTWVIGLDHIQATGIGSKIDEAVVCFRRPSILLGSEDERKAEAEQRAMDM